MTERGHGHDPGHAPGFRWDDYVAWLVERARSIAAMLDDASLRLRFARGRCVTAGRARSPA